MNWTQPLSKRQFMCGCWSRDFSYSDVMSWAKALDVEQPSEEEYAEFCMDAEKQFALWVKRMVGKA